MEYPVLEELLVLLKFRDIDSQSRGNRSLSGLLSIIEGQKVHSGTQVHDFSLQRICVCRLKEGGTQGELRNSAPLQAPQTAPGLLFIPSTLRESGARTLKRNARPP